MAVISYIAPGLHWSQPPEERRIHDDYSQSYPDAMNLDTPNPINNLFLVNVVNTAIERLN